MIRSTIPLALLVALGACAHRAPSPATGPAAIGQTVWVDGPTVTPLALVEDSRCPAHARCVWAGTVRVRVRISGGAWREERVLTLGEAQAVADGAIRLVDVAPPRLTDRPLKPSDYRFTFQFDGGL